MKNASLLNDISITYSPRDSIAPNIWVVTVGNHAKLGPYGGTIYPIHSLGTIRALGVTMADAIQAMLNDNNDEITPRVRTALEELLANPPSVTQAYPDTALTLSPNDRYAPNKWVISNGAQLHYPLAIGDHIYHIHNRYNSAHLSRIAA